MSKPSALTPTLPTPTTTKALPSTTSSAIRKQTRLLKKHANLSRETVAATISPNDETTTPRTGHLVYEPHPDASKEAHENTYLSLLQWSYVPTALAPFSDVRPTLRA